MGRKKMPDRTQINCRIFSNVQLMINDLQNELGCSANDVLNACVIATWYSHFADQPMDYYKAMFELRDYVQCEMSALAYERKHNEK